MNRRRQIGLTLLEVLLAVVLITVLLGAAVSFYRSAMEARTRVLAAAELASAHRLVMDRITTDLRSIVASRATALALQGDTGGMSFSTTTVQGPEAWVIPEATDARPPAQGDLQAVGYRLRGHEDEQHVWQIDGLERTLQRNPLAPPPEGGPGGTLLSGRLKFLRLRYWDGGAWTSAWNSGDAPGAVEVALGAEPLPEGVDPADYPFETFRRVIYLPASNVQAAGTVVRGLGGEEP